MKCVCIKECQTRNSSGKVQFFMRGDVYDFKKCPTHFRPLEGPKAEGVDFATAGEQELLEAEYDLDELKDYIKEKYDRKPGNRGKERTVAMLLDCRFRDIDGVL